MSDATDAVKILYHKFVMRDIFSFITPGAILLLSLMYLFGSDMFGVLHLSKEIHFLAYLPLFGVFYALGIFCMSAGAFIFDNPPLPVHTRQHLIEHLTIISDFNRKTKEDREAQFQHERFIVLKQICGNNAVALSLSGIIILLRFFINGFQSRWTFSSLLFSITLIIISIVLYYAHRSCLEQQEVWEDLYTKQ